MEKFTKQNYIFAKRAGISGDEQELVSVLEHARDEFIRKIRQFRI